MLNLFYRSKSTEIVSGRHKPVLFGKLTLWNGSQMNMFQSIVSLVCFCLQLCSFVVLYHYMLWPVGSAIVFKINFLKQHRNRICHGPFHG